MKANAVWQPPNRKVQYAPQTNPLGGIKRSTFGRKKVLRTARNELPSGGLTYLVNVASQSEDRCPVCGNLNHCRIAAGHAYKGDCWCNESTVPSHILRFVAEKLETACLCERCLDGLAYYAQYSHHPRGILDLLHEEIRRDPNSPNSYSDHQGRMVFTAAYLLKRGHCCESNCRHCPYSFPLCPK